MWDLVTYKINLLDQFLVFVIKGIGYEVWVGIDDPGLIVIYVVYVKIYQSLKHVCESRIYTYVVDFALLLLKPPLYIVHKVI